MPRPGKCAVDYFTHPGIIASIGYLHRMDHDTLSWFKPDAAILCSGMNGGSYTELTPAVAQSFENPSRKILEKFGTAAGLPWSKAVNEAVVPVRSTLKVEPAG